VNTEEKLLEKIKQNTNLPVHVAIIMDGNGRWAKSKGLPRVAGHREGINSVKEIVETSTKLGIKYLTLYTFSKENWKRPKSEVSALMKLLLKTVKKEIYTMLKNNVRLKTIGNLEDLPNTTRNEIIEAMERTKNNTGLTLNLALSYSGRLEIINTIKTIAQKVKNKEILINHINENLVSEHLYTSQIPDPDLLIRTSGESRISNFLLWQLAYTEIYFTDVLWPEFRKKNLYEAVIDYQSRERRFGKVSEQISQK